MGATMRRNWPAMMIAFLVVLTVLLFALGDDAGIGHGPGCSLGR